MLGINSQLVEINLNRRLSRIVRNLASTNIVVMVIMEYDGLNKYGITIPAMVTIICSKMIYHMFGTG